jgi:multicomponent Na+:H+ antiporter subunit F
MSNWVFHVAGAGLGLAVLLGLWRLARGPTVLDRIVAFDVVTVSVVGMMTVLSLRWRTTEFLELILVFTLLGFVQTVALTQYLQKTLERRQNATRAPESEPGGER